MIVQIVSFILAGASILCILALLFCFYMLDRNNTVFKFRMSLIDNEEYDKYPDYPTMFWYFWIPLNKERWRNFDYPEADNIITAIKNGIKRCIS